MYPYISTPYRHYRIVAENQGNHCAREIERIKGKEERSEVQRENRRRTTSAGYRVRCVMSCDTMRCDTPEGGPEGDPISRFRIPSVDLIKTSRKLDLIIVQIIMLQIHNMRMLRTTQLLNLKLVSSTISLIDSTTETILLLLNNTLTLSGWWGWELLVVVVVIVVHGGGGEVG